MRQVPLSAGIVVWACAAAFGQAESLTFEVASVKPAAPPAADGRMFFGGRGGPGTPDPGQITWTNATLKTLLTIAYGVKTYQVNGPAWIDTERYDIIAKVPEGATKEQVSVMWQNLLKERFGMALHHESKEFQVSELVVGKGGSKLKETAVDPNAAPPSPPTGPPQGPPKLDKNGFPEMNGPGLVMMFQRGSSGPVSHVVARAQPISGLTTMLGNQLNRPVVDKTGLTGMWDFAMEFTPEGSGDAVATAPTFLQALREQLGLKLESEKGPVDSLVVDHVERPSAN